MYEIFEQLLEINGITIYKFCKDTHISESTIYTWKKKKSVARPELAEKVCKYFDISIDFLMGKTDMVICPICGFGDNPLSANSKKEHEQFHKKYLEIKEFYPSLMPHADAALAREDSIRIVRNLHSTLQEKLDAFSNYLDAEFSLQLLNSKNPNSLDLNDFCKSEVIKLIPDPAIDADFLNILLEDYDIDMKYVESNEILLAKTSNNGQLMRILSYMEKLNNIQLDSLEIQIKALAENNSNEG